jgi:6-pyruvoyltetrahydropterin/6-carboxytetrahydropterin synthase
LVPQPEVLITRRIEIDAGHRIPEHGSKCRGLHGHRYVITAGVSAQLVREGEERDMAMDFGFLKNIMMAEIHDPCDHGLILRWDDPWITYLMESDIEKIEDSGGYMRFTTDNHTQLYLIQHSPTAERLAEHWFHRLSPRVIAHTLGQGRLVFVKVQETPNCEAVYAPK